MIPNKRKIILSDESEEDDSFKHRRSSLQVNLSYSTDLTDSGNGSLWKTDITNNETKETNKSQVSRRLSRRKNTHETKNHQSDFGNLDKQTTSNTNRSVVVDDGTLGCIKEGIQLKELIINLEDISLKEKILETNCKRLKDAILSKTKDMFDKQNELSVKTAKVFGNEKDHCINSTRQLNNDTENKTVIVLDTTVESQNKTTLIADKSHITNNQQRENVHSAIIATPISSGRQTFKRMINKSRLSQKRLFVEPGKQKCKIIKDVVLEQKFPLLSLRRADQADSPILSSSNRRLSLLKRLSKSQSLQSQSENHNNTYSTVQCDQSINIGAPIISSTFIEDNGTNGKGDKTMCEMNDDTDASYATYTTNKTVSMEMTEINSDIQTRQGMLVQNKNDPNDYIKPGIEKNSETESLIERRNAAVQRQDETVATSKFAHSHSSNINDSNNEIVKSIYIDTVRPSIEEIKVIRKSDDGLQRHERDDIKTQNNRQRVSPVSDSDDTIRSSLNVNTSLDVAATINKARNVSKEFRITGTNHEFATTTYNGEPITLKNQRETVDSEQISLQVNTSVHSICRTWRRNSYFREASVQNIDNLVENHLNVDSQCLSESESERDDVDSLENMSLIERLRNISTRNQVSKMDNKKKTDTLTSAKCQTYDKRTSNSSDNYVEATPYPISRSVLFKSQLKHKTQNLDNKSTSNINSVVTEEVGDRTKLDASYPFASDVLVSNETSKIIESDTVILEDTPNDTPFVTNNTLIVIKDTPSETTSEKIEKTTKTLENTESISMKKGKRKLLPLHESSQLYSFTPLDESKCKTAESSTPVKKNKTLKKKRQKPANVKNKDKHNIITDKETWSDSDYDTVIKNKKKEEKKMRKPRKIVSKRIVIKKFAEENILNILRENKQGKEDETMENRESLDDFAKHRIISTQWNKYKSYKYAQKIIIATTGLSKGDKSLVRSIVKSLGAAEMELNVSKRTTHVVSTGVRTVNLLRGLIRGCWLITLEWVLKSLENNAWLDPDEFEMKHFSKAVQENRKDRQLFGPSYIPELFSTCGFIHVEHKTALPGDTLKELVKTAGGHITENVKLAKIIIGENGLKDTWVIDSITTGELQLTKLYERK